MEEVQGLVEGLLEDMQRIMLDYVPKSYSVWIVNTTLFIDCITFEDQGGPDDLNFIHLAVRLGWVTRAIVISVHEQFSGFYQDRYATYRKAKWEGARVILKALKGLPYTIDEGI